ncbi:Mitochondrial outer membrane protein porin 1 [Nakaseomyces bracarensis]|uniref:Mitochondrial outer membrane protein porin 1 n=1 Tax=Nakaseomyces bracarensis TaxID=273131 RepID=A0ABR4NMY7_9SACH
MSPIGFNDISQRASGVLGRDFFHNGGVVQVSTSAPGINFNARSAANDGKLSMNVSGRCTDKASGVSVTQSISDKNQMNTKVELNKPGLRSDVTAMWDSFGSVKSGKITVNYTNALLNSKWAFDLMNPAKVVSLLTLGHGKFVSGSQIHYDMANNVLSKYALAMGYYPSKYHVTFMITDAQLLSMTLYQKVTSQLEVGAKSTIKLDKPSQNSIEIAAAIRQNDAQYKAKINDIGLACLSYKMPLRQGISLGLGVSLDTLNPSDSFKKFGWSLAISK